MGFHHLPQIVTNGLIACQDVANAKAAPSASAYLDLITGASGYLYGTPTCNSQGVTLNGSSQWVATPNIWALFSNDNITIDVWARPTGNGVVVTEGDKPTGPTWHATFIEIVAGNAKMRTWSTPALDLGACSFNQWHHFVHRYSVSGTLLNGWLDGTKSANFVVAGRTSPIGGYSSIHYLAGPSDTTHMGSGAFFPGIIGPMKVYNRVLTDAEVTQNFNASRKRFGL